MRRTTTVASASAAVLCLGVLLAGCGSAAGAGHAAVGAAGPGDGRAPTQAVPPRDGVQLVPLDGDRSQARNGGKDGSGGGTESGRPGTRASDGSGKGGTADGAPPSGSPGPSGARHGSSAPTTGAHPGHGGATTP
ncbi:hypothetical protein IQ293_33320, partial [Streptomyces platensis]|nr:hypothetical protein [Streptomyces platensis]